MDQVMLLLLPNTCLSMLNPLMEQLETIITISANLIEAHTRSQIYESFVGGFGGLKESTHQSLSPKMF